MSDLTAEERKWVKRLQKVLNECPSKRLGFYTTGDPTVTIYDKSKDDAIDVTMMRSTKDFCMAANEHDAILDFIKFPSNVHATAG